MNNLLILAFLFYIGSHIGWIIELFFRRFFTQNRKEHKWINPGFCVGPYLPIYGIGLCVLFIVAYMGEYYHIDRWIIFIIMAVSMTLNEYIGGLFFLKVMNIRLWDYRDMWGNIQGLICPLFSFFWTVMGAVYFFFVHEHIYNSLIWFSKNLAFSFFIGLFFGVFIIDVIYSGKVVRRLKKFAKDNDVIVHIENIKSLIKVVHLQIEAHSSFMFPFVTHFDLKDKLLEVKEDFEKRRKKH